MDCAFKEGSGVAVLGEPDPGHAGGAVHGSGGGAAGRPGEHPRRRGVRRVAAPGVPRQPAELLAAQPGALRHQGIRAEEFPDFPAC